MSYANITIAYYGFFSQKAYNLWGGCYWSTPDGREVLVTLVDGLDYVPDTYRWDDVDELGPVTDFLRSDKRCFDWVPFRIH